MKKRELDRLLKQLHREVSYLSKISAEFSDLEPLLKKVAYQSQADNLRFQAHRKGGLAIILYDLWSLSRRLQWFLKELLLKLL